MINRKKNHNRNTTQFFFLYESIAQKKKKKHILTEAKNVGEIVLYTHNIIKKTVELNTCTSSTKFQPQQSSHKLYAIQIFFPTIDHLKRVFQLQYSSNCKYNPCCM